MANLINKLIYKKIRGILRGGLLERIFIDAAFHRALDRHDNVLIIGSSCAQNGIISTKIDNATLIAAPSQDIYYSIKLAKKIIDNEKNDIHTCVFILGYYTAFQDLSLQSKERIDKVGGTYWPLLNDSHNWRVPYNPNYWHKGYRYPKKFKQFAEKIVYNYFYKNNSYYDDLARRENKRMYGGRTWDELSDKEKHSIADVRTKSHNKLFKYKDAYAENIKLLSDFQKELKKKNIRFIYMNPPFSRVYRTNINKEYKNKTQQMLKEANIEWIDFNDRVQMEDACFVDADHLNEYGAILFTKSLISILSKRG